MIDSPYDALKDGINQAQVTLRSYSDQDPSIVYENSRVMQSVDSAFGQLLASEAPPVIIRFIVEMVALNEVRRIERDLPALTVNDVSEIVRDFWRKLREWILND